MLPIARLALLSQQLYHTDPFFFSVCMYGVTSSTHTEIHTYIHARTSCSQFVFQLVGTSISGIFFSLLFGHHFTIISGSLACLAPFKAIVSRLTRQLTIKPIFLEYGYTSSKWLSINGVALYWPYAALTQRLYFWPIWRNPINNDPATTAGLSSSSVHALSCLPRAGLLKRLWLSLAVAEIGF